MLPVAFDMQKKKKKSLLEWFDFKLVTMSLGICGSNQNLQAY